MKYAGVGSRRAPEGALRLIGRIAARLAQQGWTLRSGGTPGADQAWEAGALSARGRVEIYLPWPFFQGYRSCRVGVVLDEPTQEALGGAARLHPFWEKLAPPSRKAVARYHHVVLGHSLRDPVDFVVCWTPDGAEGARETTPGTGDVGQAIRLADGWRIPVINLANGQGPERIAQLLKKLGGGG